MQKKFLFDRWQTACRLKGEEKFTLLPNPEWGWVADPFPVMYQGSLYIFAEIFLYKSERNGVIAYCKLEDGEFTGWEVSMDKHWHLSYPNVFVCGGRLYMCPETRQNDEIAVYELKAFPDQWEKRKVLLSNVQCVDTTFCHDQGKKYMFTFRPQKGGIKGRLYLYQIDGMKLTEGRMILEDTGTQNARPGGRILCEAGKLFRVSQNGSEGYGSGLVFSVIDSLSPVYREHVIRRITAGEIEGNWNRKFSGIHTYNRSDEIEVVDLKYRTFSLSEYWARRRVRKVFAEKYPHRTFYALGRRVGGSLK